jgi:hypothetical protein
VSISNLNKQYVIGRGKIYFDQFLTGTQTKQGERYLGNTPSLAMNSTYTNLEHYDADEGLRVRDDSVQLQNDRGGSFQCDNIIMENIAMMFGAATGIQTQVGYTGEAELLTVIKGLFYQLGVDSALPDGVGKVANLQVTNNAGAHAVGTVTVAAQPSPADTLTINGQVITFVAGAPAAHQVQIGGSFITTAQGILQEVNAYPHLYHVKATGAAAIVTLTAAASGVAGNAITLAKSGTNPTLSGATLAGGTASGIIPALGNYEVDLNLGRIHILETAVSIADAAVIEVQYDIVSGTRSLVTDEQNTLEGALRFIADNARGPDKDYFWPRVKVTPSGDFQLKGEAWQTMTMNFEVLQPAGVGVKRVYVRER